MRDNQQLPRRFPSSEGYLLSFVSPGDHLERGGKIRFPGSAIKTSSPLTGMGPAPGRLSADC